MTDTADLGQRAARLVWACEANNWERITWSECEKRLGMDRVKFRSAARAYKARNPDEFKRSAPQVTESTGVTVESTLPDPEEVYRRACEVWRKTERLAHERSHQRIVFDHGPVCLVEMADLHLGGEGVDYPRIREEAEIVAETPGMFLFAAGDWVDQMIVGKLANERFTEHLSVPDEWALARLILSIVQDKLEVAVLGNHDNWAEMLTGVSYFQRELANLAPKVIYDTDDALIEVVVGGWSIPTRVRHKWRGNSQWNDTHPIEKAAKFDQDFLIGMGAHTHASGLTRPFNAADGGTGMAMLAGSYKVWEGDSYARRQGFTKPNGSTAVSVVIDEDTHSLTGFTNLEAASNYMGAMYR